MKLNRRHFLELTGITCLAATAGVLPATSESEEATEARYYEKLPNKKIKCVLCPRECVIDDLERGYCGVRENRDGTYYTLVYGRPCTIHVDPIEKKPLYHFYPGTTAFSTSTVGCNINCKFCQNWEISQTRPEQSRYYDLDPKSFVEACIRYNAPTIAYTYAEPVVFAEYMHDVGAEAQARGIKNVMISNGYINEPAMRDLLGVLDAVKIDLKSFRETYYRDVCDGELKPVLDTLVLLAAAGVWLEIVYLVVPTLNDGEDELREMSHWCVKNLGPDVPFHFSRFYPHYRLKNLPPTPIPTLEKARDIYREAGGRYAYIGNVSGHEAGHTYCPGCGSILIRRNMYDVTIENLKNGACRRCGEIIHGIWENHG